VSLLAIKLRRDLRASWSRFVLMAIAIAVTLTAVGAVLFAWAAAARETRNAYMSTEPASATILLDRPIDAQEMTRIAAEAREQPGVLEASGRTQFTGEVAVNGRLSRIPLQVFVATPDDPLRMARFFMDERSWPPSPSETFLGRDSVSLLGATVGDTLTVEAPDGRSLRLRVADTVYDPSLSPSPQEQTARAYLSTRALAARPGAAQLDQLKIQVAESGQQIPSRDRDEIVKVAGVVGEWLQREHGLTITEIQVPTPYAHPHQWQADALLGALLIGAAAALLLSSILVANMLNNLFTQQIPQIGIMKAIGAGSARIARLYLAMTLLVGVAATSLALAPAVVLGRLAVKTFLSFLGIEPQSLAPPGWTYVVIVGVGLALPPLMTVISLVKASRTTVRAAIDHRGLGSKPSAAATGILARLGRMPKVDRGLLMALRNTVRRPARFLLSVGLLATAGTVFVAGMSLSAGVEAVRAEQKEQRTWDVDVQLATPASRSSIDALVEDVPGVAAIEAFNVAPAGVAGPGELPVTRTYPDQGHGRVSVTSLPADPRTFSVPTMLEGRWLKPGETGAIVLNQVTRKNTVPGVGAGDTVQLIVGGKSTTWRVVGIAQERQNHGGVYTTSEGFAQAMDQPQLVIQLRVFTDTHDEKTREQVALQVEDQLSEAGIEVSSAASITRSEAISEGHLGPVVLILLGVAIPLGVVGVIGLASTMSANVLDRTREFGVMHAIGAVPKAVRRIVIAEGIFVAVTSCLIAIIPALVLTALLGAGLGNLFFSAPLPFSVSLLAVGIWFALVILGSILATDTAATRASRLTVREALAYL
jgi:putative ABC transport system permease protein